MSGKTTMGKLGKGMRARVVAVGNGSGDQGFVHRLEEMGFLPGATVEVVEEAPFSHDPVAIRVRESVFALRRAEANLVEVEIEQPQVEKRRNT